MKKIICFVLILAFAIPLIYAGGNRDRGPSGRIVIYTSMYDEAIENIKRELHRKFPRCTIEFVSRGTGIIEGYIATEEAAGRLGCDILMIAEQSYSIELKEKRMLHSFRSNEASSLAFDYDPDGYWYPVRISNMVLAYNPLRQNRNAIPNSFYDFANDARVRGAVSMRNPLVSGTTLAAISALRDKYGNEYFQALGRQRVIIDYGSSESTRKLETGESAVVMILEESILRKRQEENSRLEIIYPSDGAIVIPSNIMIINNRWSANRNTAAAEAIVEWFLSPEGQNAIVSGWMHSVRKDFPRLPHGSVPTAQIQDGSIPVNWNNVYRQKNELRNRFEDYAIRR
jgi:iron(III) transport system substrate-binding protein